MAFNLDEWCSQQWKTSDSRAERSKSSSPLSSPLSSVNSASFDPDVLTSDAAPDAATSVVDGSAFNQRPGTLLLDVDMQLDRMLLVRFGFMHRFVRIQERFLSEFLPEQKLVCKRLSLHRSSKVGQFKLPSAR